MEKIMNMWTKISSLAVITFLFYGVFYAIYVTIRLLSSPIQIGMTSTMVFLTVMNALAIFLFGPPLFYFGWVKKPKNKQMKLWAKVLTIFLPIPLILGFISPWGIELSDLLDIIPTLFFMVPLYYYAWR